MINKSRLMEFDVQKLRVVSFGKAQHQASIKPRQCEGDLAARRVSGLGRAGSVGSVFFWFGGRG